MNLLMPDTGHDVFIKATGVGVRYKTGRKREDLKSIVLNRRGKAKSFWALSDVTFSSFPGDIIGVIGSNGAGKTTLCRVMANLLKPSCGEIVVRGNVSALLSLGTGFDRELTGRENIFLNGMMLGFTKKLIESIYEDIVEFSGLDNFIHQPIKNYSSGMKARLAFSITTMLQPEILILDEALSTGDSEFKSRAMEKTKEMVEKAKIVVIVSHDIDFIAENCTKAFWIDRGQLVTEGDPDQVCAAYREMAEKQGNKPVPRKLRLKRTKSKAGTEDVIIASNLGLCYPLNGEEFWALRNCNFSVKVGEIVGIIGPNGAGKSTLCKILSGILRPDEGSIHTEGEISALLSFGTGFNSQLSGRDNILLNGLMLGIPKKEIIDIYEDIVSFAGLEEFIDDPTKNYSSGMVSRLGFSIATMMEPDIFIIDEALSAGDMIFYERASARIQEMINSAKAVIIVTHSMKFVRKVCTKAIWLKKGRIMHVGKPEETIALYDQDVDKNKKNKDMR